MDVKQSPRRYTFELVHIDSLPRRLDVNARQIEVVDLNEVHGSASQNVKRKLVSDSFETDDDDTELKSDVLFYGFMDYLVKIYLI